MSKEDKKALDELVLTGGVTSIVAGSNITVNTTVGPDQLTPEVSVTDFTFQRWRFISTLIKNMPIQDLTFTVGRRSTTNILIKI